MFSASSRPTPIITGVVFFSAFCCALPGVASAQGLDNEGTDFLCAFLPNPFVGGSTPAHDVEIHLTSRVPATVTIEWPSENPTFTEQVMVTPGTIEIVAVDTGASLNWTADAVSENLVSIESDEEVTAYLINRRAVSSDAALALPLDTMNTEYQLTDYDPASSAIPACFTVFARFDDTEVTITPTVSLQGGHAAGVPFVVTLDAGEGYYGEALLSAGLGTITGTTIESTRVVGVTNGVQCTNVPVNSAFCDHIFEVAAPVQTWAPRYLVANLPQRPNGTRYRVQTSTDATEILLDGVSQGTINRGEFTEIGPIATDSVIESAGDEPIFVAQFMTSRIASGTQQGDPAMGNVIAPEQFKPEYTFSTVGGSQFTDHFVTIIAENSDIGLLMRDGAVVPSSDFSSIPGTVYSVARIPVAEGTHTTSSPSPHGITVQGYNLDDSYLYPGGARFEFIFSAGDDNAPLCNLDYSAGTASGVAQDDRPSEDVNGNGVLDPGEDLNGNGQIDEDRGIFFVALDPASTNLDLDVPAFQSGAGQVTFTVTLTDPALDGAGSVVITDGGGNETACEVVIDGTLGIPVCTAVENSTGQPALTTARGSLSASVNGLSLRTRHVPQGSFGYYVNSRTPGIVMNPGGSTGNLCIADPVSMGRHDADGMTAGPDELIFLDVDLAAIPMQPIGPMTAVAGETWYWQLWYRDTVAGMPTSNFCNAVEVALQ